MKVLVLGSNPKHWSVDGYIHVICNLDHRDGSRISNYLDYIQEQLANGVTFEYTNLPL
jgi:hypothetical protein